MEMPELVVVVVGRGGVLEHRRGRVARALSLSDTLIATALRHQYQAHPTPTPLVIMCINGLALGALHFNEQ
jgi:hypothetical protein